MAVRCKASKIRRRRKPLTLSLGPLLLLLLRTGCRGSHLGYLFGGLMKVGSRSSSRKLRGDFLTEGDC